MMDMRIQSGIPLGVQTERLYQQHKTQTPAATQDEEPNFLQTLQEKEIKIEAVPAREAILTMPELATLHALFGSEKPPEQSLYGKNSSAQIYKGHLIDVAG